MTVLDHRPRSDRTASDWAPRLHRRHEIVTTGGMGGALHVGAALQTCGYPVRDFAVEVREGIVYSTVTCTVSLTPAEAEIFAERLRELPAVIAVDLR
jgi:hypothetical protein